MKPGDTHPGPDRRHRHVKSPGFYAADHLMARDDPAAPGRKLALHDMEICVADAADLDPDEHLPALRLGTRPFDLPQRAGLHGGRMREDQRSHDDSSSVGDSLIPCGGIAEGRTGTARRMST